FNQANEALRLVKMSTSKTKICHFDDFVVHHFLKENISTIDMRKFFEDALGELYQYDKKNSTELMMTLEAWIENNFNIAKTSRYLYTHRNTVLYRMDKISDMLNSDLKDGNELLKYQLALKIYRLLEL
ncbi:MAG TPA: PucR family transcriptional regulator, partial [Epulopiscium sp.]|nr:PucR family transcriptional regulator [Candidatus Epulonipiscium sp.]